MKTEEIIEEYEKVKGIFDSFANKDEVKLLVKEIICITLRIGESREKLNSTKVKAKDFYEKDTSTNPHRFDCLPDKLKKELFFNALSFAMVLGMRLEFSELVSFDHDLEELTLTTSLLEDIIDFQYTGWRDILKYMDRFNEVVNCEYNKRTERKDSSYAKQIQNHPCRQPY